MQATATNACMYQEVKYMANIGMFSLDFERHVHKIVAVLLILIYTTQLSGNRNSSYLSVNDITIITSLAKNADMDQLKGSMIFC